MGLQVRPMGTATPERTIPRRPVKVAISLLSDDWTESQHCKVPVLH